MPPTVRQAKVTKCQQLPIDQPTLHTQNTRNKRANFRVGGPDRPLNRSGHAPSRLEEALQMRLTVNYARTTNDGKDDDGFVFTFSFAAICTRPSMDTASTITHFVLTFFFTPTGHLFVLVSFLATFSTYQNTARVKSRRKVRANSRASALPPAAAAARGGAGK